MRDISPMHFMDLSVPNTGRGAPIGQSGTIATCTDLVQDLRVEWHIVSTVIETVPTVRFTGAPAELQEVLRRYDALPPAGPATPSTPTHGPA